MRPITKIVTGDSNKDVYSAVIPVDWRQPNLKIALGVTYLNANSTPSDQLPDMTSDTAPAGNTASASNFSTGNNPFQAFDASATTIWEVENFASPEYIQIQVTAAIAVRTYTIRMRTALSDVANTPKSWQLQGSNNGSDWVTIDTQSDIVWIAAETKTFETTNAITYTYHRLLISENNGGDDLEIEDIQLFNNIATGVYDVEHTFDNIQEKAFLPQEASWFKHEFLFDKTASEDGNYAYPPTAVRLKLQSGFDGNVKFQIIQA